MKKCGFHENDRLAKKGTAIITQILREHGYTVVNVEDRKSYQARDIDFCAFHPIDGDYFSGEIKVDRNYRTGNFFFEIVSNDKKGTPGCFLYTEADLIYYLFYPEMILYIIPVEASRDWFLANKDSLETRSTETIGKNGKPLYRSEGKLVNRELLKSLVNIQVIQIPDSWQN